MMNQTLLYLLIIINIVAFLVYGIDKWMAKQGYWRISEATLLILAVIGGSIGALLGMEIWHHKTMQEIQIWSAVHLVSPDSPHLFVESKIDSCR